MSCIEKTKSSRNAGTLLVPAHLAVKTTKNDKIWCPGQKQPNGVCAVVGVSVLVSRAVLARMGKQPVTWALAFASASASGSASFPNDRLSGGVSGDMLHRGSVSGR